MVDGKTESCQQVTVWWKEGASKQGRQCTHGLCYLHSRESEAEACAAKGSLTSHEYEALSGAKIDEIDGCVIGLDVSANFQLVGFPLAVCAPDS